MKNITKILAFISLVTIVFMFTGGVSAANYAESTENNIQASINDTPNDIITVNNTNKSFHTSSTNLKDNLSQKNTTGIIMANTDYNCGPAALATVMRNYFGINITQDQLAALAGTDKNGTTMYGLAQTAKQQGLIVKGFKLTAAELKPGNIVYLTVNGKGHYSVISKMTNTTVYLADPNIGNINMTLSNFKAAYSGNTLVITTNTNDKQLTSGIKLTNEEMQKIIGKKYDVDWPRTGVKLAGCAMIAFGVLTLDPIPVIGGIATVSSAYVR